MGGKKKDFEDWSQKNAAGTDFVATLQEHVTQNFLIVEQRRKLLYCGLRHEIIC